MNKTKLVLASAYSSIVTVIFVTVITVWAELNAPLKTWLADLSGHHWTSKSILSVGVYVLLLLFFYTSIRARGENAPKRALTRLLVVTVLGVLVIALFYTAHHLKLI